MPMFRCDFDATGDLVLPPGIDCLNFSSIDGFKLTVRNAPVDSEGHAPSLMVCVIGPADSIDSAQEQLRAALATQFDLLSFATHSRFRIVAPKRLVEWADSQKRRHFDVFFTTDARYPPDPELDETYLETVAVLDAAKPPEFVRMALRYFRYGLIDTQTEDQFMRFWLALEILAENVKDRSSVPIICPNCKAALKCGTCGVEPTRVPMAKQAIENIISKITGAAAPVVSKRLFKARNGLMHGRSSRAIEADCGERLRHIVNELASITWHGIMSSIPLDENGPPLNFGHRDGEFASGSLVFAVRGVFDHVADGPHPSDEQIPKVEIGMNTTFRPQT